MLPSEAIAINGCYFRFSLDDAPLRMDCRIHGCHFQVGFGNAPLQSHCWISGCHFRVSLVDDPLRRDCWINYYRKRGSASYIVREVLSVRERERERDTDRERERERDGSDVTIVALKLAMNLHFPLPKIRTFRFSLHTSRLSLHGEVTWRWNSQWVHTFPCQKKFRPLCSPSFKWHEPRDEWSKTQDNDQILPSPILFFPMEKLNQINTKNYWK